MNGYKNCQDNLKIEYIENIETLNSFVFRAPSLVSVLSILNVAHHKLLPTPADAHAYRYCGNL